jgi:hypothetical protein
VHIPPFCVPSPRPSSPVYTYYTLQPLVRLGTHHTHEPFDETTITTRLSKLRSHPKPRTCSCLIVREIRQPLCALLRLPASAQRDPPQLTPARAHTVDAVGPVWHGSTGLGRVRARCAAPPASFGRGTRGVRVLARCGLRAVTYGEVSWAAAVSHARGDGSGAPVFWTAGGKRYKSEKGHAGFEVCFSLVSSLLCRACC